MRTPSSEIQNAIRAFSPETRLESQLWEALVRMLDQANSKMAPVEWSQARLCREAGGINPNTLHKRNKAGVKYCGRILNLLSLCQDEPSDLSENRRDHHGTERRYRRRIQALTLALSTQARENWLLQKALVEQQQIVEALRERYEKCRR